MHLTPKARAFFFFSYFRAKRRFCQVFIAFGAGDQHVTGLPPKAMIFVIYLCARDKVHEHNSLLYICNATYRQESFDTLLISLLRTPRCADIRPIQTWSKRPSVLFGLKLGLGSALDSCSELVRVKSRLAPGTD